MGRFTKKYVLSICAAIALGLTGATSQTDPPPPWAYPMAAPDYKAPVDDGTLRHVPGSSASWTLSQLNDRFFAPDWHPDEHPRMPEVVAHGRKPNVFACGYCHCAEGTGGPENANIAGLPEAYIIQQMADFKSGARKRPARPLAEEADEARRKLQNPTSPTRSMPGYPAMKKNL